MGLHFGGFIVWRGVLVAREPASRSVNKTSLSASRNADRLRNGLLRSVGACRLCVDRPRRRPRAPSPGPVGQLGRLSETPVAFARSSVRGVETVVAFVGAKWAFLVHFSVAVVLPVSMVAVWGEQWCRRFHAGLYQWLQRCYWFQRRHVVAPRARKSSPCSA